MPQDKQNDIERQLSQDSVPESPQNPDTGGVAEIRARRSSLLTRTMLWVLAVFIAFAAMVYQRRTGPTHPYRGEVSVGDKAVNFEVIRSQERKDAEGKVLQARIAIPDPGDIKATLSYKRFKTTDEFTTVEMKPETGEDKAELAGYLPTQPSAGKLEYYIELAPAAGGEGGRIPMDGEKPNPVDTGTQNIVLRYKDFVPRNVLWPHVIMMIFSILIGMRAGLGALFAPDSMRLWVWCAVIGMTIGGMTLGPIVQKYAFGEYWTGFPFGGDWTDNKMLIMWVAWLVAVLAVGTRAKKKEAPARVMVVLAAIVMTGVYMIPHSMAGSELDWEKLEQVDDPTDAIETGR